MGDVEHRLLALRRPGGVRLVGEHRQYGHRVRLSLHGVGRRAARGVLPASGGPHDAVLGRAAAVWQGQEAREYPRELLTAHGSALLGQGLGGFPGEGEHGPGPEAVDLACGGTPERLFLLDLELGLPAAGARLAVLVEEGVHRLTERLSVAVAVGAGRHRHVLGRAEERVEAFEPGEDLQSAPLVEVVLLLGQQNQGFGRMAGEHVVHVHAHTQQAGRNLLAVGGELVLGIAPEGGDIASRRGHGEAVVVGHQQRRQRAAAGVSGEPDSGRVDLLAGQEVVEAPHAVPDPPCAEELANEELVVGRVDVLGDADAIA